MCPNAAELRENGVPELSFDEKERERFRKIVSVMEGATIDGERAAAKIAAERLAAARNMSLEEAVRETHPERDDGQLDAEERRARRADRDAWAASRAKVSEAQERAERYRYEQALREAEARGLEREAPTRKPSARARYSPTYRSARYRSNKDDRMRLISGLLREGASLRRVADLTGASTNEVARIWLMMR